MKTETAQFPADTPATSAPRWAALTATFFGIGRLQPGPGTWGSLSATLIWFGVSRWVPVDARPATLATLAAVAIALGIPAATRVANASATKDPQFVVIDEVAGQWITFLFVPVSWKTLLAGFILFRGFDIVKPPPVRQLEKLPGGSGIVLDDVAAGIFALIVMQLLLHFGLLSNRL
ncbi:MAG TPA: phosphatidylglycerophosphatase A [Terriglobales bacterium]|nr:phosphatidylglycerophosphatase A [Terriglobales bacterium]